MSINETDSCNNNGAAVNFNFGLNEEQAVKIKFELDSKKDLEIQDLDHVGLNEEQAVKFKVELDSTKDLKIQDLDQYVGLNGEQAVKFKIEVDSTKGLKTQDLDQYVPVLQDLNEANDSTQSEQQSVDFELDDIVWGKLSKHPYWPAIICVDETSDAYLSDDKYHVKFLGDNRTAWIARNWILPYKGIHEFEERRKKDKKLGFHMASNLSKYVRGYHEAVLLDKLPRNYRMEFLNEILMDGLEVKRTQESPATPSNLDNINNNAPEETLLKQDHHSVLLNARKRVFEFFAERSLSGGDQNTSIDTCLNLVQKIWELRLIKVKNPISSARVKKDKPIPEESDATNQNRRNLTVARKSGRSRTPVDRYSYTDFNSMQKTDIEAAEKRQKKIDERIERATRKAETIKQEFKDYNLKRKSSNFLLTDLRNGAVCRLCFQSGNLVKCTWECSGYYHVKCCENPPFVLEALKNLSSQDEPSLEGIQHQIDGADSDVLPHAKNFVCAGCALQRLPACFACSKDDIVLGKRYRCTMADCGRYYHLNCIENWPQTQVSYSGDKVDSFCCPSHVCHMSCTPGKKEELISCVMCPATYHGDSSCIPAGSELLTSTQMVCPKHALNEKKPVHIDWCTFCGQQGSLINCETCPSAVHQSCLEVDTPHRFICAGCKSGTLPRYGEIVWAKQTKCPWWPAIIVAPSLVPDDVKHLSKTNLFCVRFFGDHKHTYLSRRCVHTYQDEDYKNAAALSTAALSNKYKKKSFESAVQEAHQYFKEIREADPESVINLRPERYQKILENIVVPPIRFKNVDMAACECFATDEHPCASFTGCMNATVLSECSLLCPAGNRCENRRFERRQYSNLKVQRIENNGWGLLAADAIPRGTFIIEYVGEVINDEELFHRFQQKTNKNDENYYFVTIESNKVIDAERKGNISRFTNHSCEPNCELQKWKVNGNTRIGLFALKDIQPDTELTFNYNSHGTWGKSMQCHCGSKLCTGNIGAQPKRPRPQSFSNEKSTTSKSKRLKK